MPIPERPIYNVDKTSWREVREVAEKTPGAKFVFYDDGSFDLLAKRARGNKAKPIKSR